VSYGLTEHQAPISPYEVLLEFLYLTPAGIVKFGPDGKIGMANPMAAQLLMPLARDCEMSDLYRIFSATLPDLRGSVEAFRSPTGTICDQLQVKVPGTGCVLTLSVNKIGPDTLMAVVQDISRSIEQETRIRDDQQRFRAIFENVRDYAIYTVGLDGRVDQWNRSLARIGGWEAADVTGAPVGVFFPAEPDDQSAAVALLDRARRVGTAEFEGWQVRRDGGAFWGNTVASSLPDHDGATSGYVLVTRDLTERKRMEDRLVTLSLTDAMTGAFNRRAGENRLDEAILGWRRERRVFSLLMIDCDHFKSINDTWGHDGGDAVLIALVRICQSKLREGDAIFRWGGEEFMALLPGTSGDTACVIAERLRQALEEAETGYAGSMIRFTVSIGVAASGGTDDGADDLILRVDQALYCAKHCGRNQVVQG
jgi:diguanylate cyclase (GGDEF)-like protein/PAS domain S-box-containing protein